MLTRDKITRLNERLRDPEWRRYGYLLLASKMLGIALLLTAVYYLSSIIGTSVTAGDVIYSVGVSGFIYPIIGHGAWGPDGFLASMGSSGNFLPAPEILDAASGYRTN